MTEKVDPLELIRSYWPAASTAHITYDPDLAEGDFNIVRGSTNDSTLLFTIQLLQRTLLPVVNCTCCAASNLPPKGATLHYTVGPLLLETLYSGLVDLPAGRYPGQVQQTTMPVKVSW